MQAAKKMYLIDQRTMDKLNVDTLSGSLKRKEDWTKSAFNRSKTCLSHEMKRILEDDLDEDIKAKQYRQVLSRFLNTQKKKIKKEDESPVLLPPPPATPPSPPLPSPVSIPKPASKTKKAKNYKAKRSPAQVKYYSPSVVVRRSKRARKWQNL